MAGLGIKLFGSQASLFYAACFHLMGYVLAYCVWLLCWHLTASRTAAWVATSLLLFSPAYVLYENWFMYTFPSAFLITAATLLLYYWARLVDAPSEKPSDTGEDSQRSGKAGWLISTFFFLLVILSLTRSLFHLVWYVAIAFILIGLYRDFWRMLVKASLVPLIILLVWYGKNYYVHGSFAGSTLLGLGLSNITTLMVPKKELLPLVENGDLSSFALKSRYTDINELFSYPAEATGIDVLDLPRKATGTYNFNYHTITRLDPVYKADSLVVISQFPFYYLHGVWRANLLFFSPSHMNAYFSAANREAVQSVNYLYNPLLYGAPAHAKQMTDAHFGVEESTYLIEVNTGYGLIIFWLAVLVYFSYYSIWGLISGRGQDKAKMLVTGFMLFNITYVWAISVSVELAENYRYKFLTEPLFIVLATVLVLRLLEYINKRA
ncbi:MAG: hypothetical protein OEZ23_05255 [Gammaproteobacteria bacterium]|nr:hypothetical protein [Gammaproteobacteria bacterium]